MSGRTYLSIGDVLALLRQEFPDVTISKIRFLESQGLVDPERTPSGYRKFYEHDVERLRWVLRQQREHFLPLKVIKGRLEQEELQGDEGNGRSTEPGVERAEPVLVGTASGRDRVTTRAPAAPGSQEAGPDGDPAAAAPAGAAPALRPSALGRSARAAEPATRSPAPAVVAGRSGPGVPSAPARAVTTATGARGGTPATAATASSTVRSPAAGGASGRVTGAGAATAGGGRGASGPGAHRAPTEAVADGDGDEAGLRLPTLSGASMTAEELAGASGLDVAAVQQLESYGLVCSRVVGGVAYYEEDALVVARLAAGFARYGVEARHLRLHKHAAEREAGFIEQIVLPLLKQRNPEARQRAHDAVTELSRLGQGLREALLRSALRDQLGG